MISLYNTLTKHKTPFEPMYIGKAGMYTCGPTVYGKVHIGNLRAYFTADMLRRTLENAGFEVRHIKNITDVGHLTADDIAQGDSGEDKITKKALAAKTTPEHIAHLYEDYFHEAERKMNILPAHYFPRATAHVSQMIHIIETLLRKNHAYAVNGNVFLDVTSFAEYGKLSGNTLEKLKVGARLEEHPDKRNPWDFALWLRAPKDHLMQWDSPWSRGYPSWHIECSAMSMEYLGESFDIHTGAEDNIFPHHEAEITQSECATGHTFVQYWVHLRHLLVDGEKMSKSKGNLYVLEDIEEHGFSAMDLRIVFLCAHYRSPMNFMWDTLAQARANRKTLESFRDRLEEYVPTSNEYTENTFDAHTHQTRLVTALEDDLNTPEAFSALLACVREGNKAMDAQLFGNTTTTKNIFFKCINLLGLLLEERGATPEAIHHLAEAREIARKAKNYTEADRLRAEIEKAGYLVEDTPHGFTVKPKK